MLKIKLASTYAQAIFELARDADKLDSVERELLAVTKALDEHEELASLLYHPRVPTAAKKDTINKVFGAELSELVRNFILLLIDKRRETSLVGIVREYVASANEARNIIEAVVTTAHPLGDTEREQLVAKLGKVTGKSVILKPLIDPTIIGGVVVQVGDKLIDGSIARQLKAMEKALLRTEAKIGVTS